MLCPMQVPTVPAISSVAQFQCKESKAALIRPLSIIRESRTPHFGTYLFIFLGFSPCRSFSWLVVVLVHPPPSKGRLITPTPTLLSVRSSPVFSQGTSRSLQAVPRPCSLSPCNNARAYIQHHQLSLSASMVSPSRGPLAILVNTAAKEATFALTVVYTLRASSIPFSPW